MQAVSVTEVERGEGEVALRRGGDARLVRFPRSHGHTVRSEAGRARPVADATEARPPSSNPAPPAPR